VLDRPEALNAWTPELGRELLACVRELADDDGVRAVVVTGAGRAFSSGADLKSGITPAEDGTLDLRGPLHDVYNPIIATIRRMPKPVIAGVNGPAAGIGASLALACDIVLAAESAYLLLAFVNVGLVPDGGASCLVPARAGFTRAAEMALLGERIPARQAYEWNLVTRVVPDAEFEDALAALATRLADGPTRALAATKRLLNEWLYGTLDRQLALEADLQQDMAGSADFMEGVMAFAEKRPPRFSGR
jgi:2-(1,2-epoxy-1,2-dihydrophenyl)acetyl-CoA isomerase